MINEMLPDLEGAYQFEENADNSSHDAGSFTVGVGKLSKVNSKPTTWLYFDWASGDDAMASGNGHHHFLTLPYKYNGFMDLFGRGNLMDANRLTTMQVTEKVKLLTWYYGSCIDFMQFEVLLTENT